MGAVESTDVPYDPVVGIQFNGISVALDGVPQQGDQYLIQSTNTGDMLGTIQGIVDNIASFPDDTNGSDERSAFIGDTIDNLNNIQDSLLQGRSRIGARLNTIDTTRSTLEAANISNQEILSDIRDLDYAEAISTLSFQSFVLEAAQQSFTRIAGLSLFNFLR